MWLKSLSIRETYIAAQLSSSEATMVNQFIVCTLQKPLHIIKSINLKALICTNFLR